MYAISTSRINVVVLYNLWEGCYKASHVQTEQYLLELYRYIELNPFWADMASDPADYRWCSYQCNA